MNELKVFYNSACRRLTGWPLVRPLFVFAYDGFAALLYRWNRARRRW